MTDEEEPEAITIVLMEENGDFVVYDDAGVRTLTPVEYCREARLRDHKVRW